MIDRKPRSNFIDLFLLLVFLSPFFVAESVAAQEGDESVVRVFIFAGQSNMVGSHSNASEIAKYPRYVGLDQPEAGVGFRYCIGRGNKTIADQWVPLHPVNNIFGPELSFARKIAAETDGKIAIIKVAAGGTHLGGDWNPDVPQDYKLYPLALEFVKEALADLEEQGMKYRLEGFMWHQGENDMFDQKYKKKYGANLKNFIACWRHDLDCPDLNFYIGELCTKTVWGMDLRDSMYAISVGQKQVAAEDDRVQYVPTSHNSVRVGKETGLHYHYGTLGQLQHGECYAKAYLDSIGVKAEPRKELEKWPYPAGSKVKLFVMAGHRNMEGERAFVQELAENQTGESLLRPNEKIAFKYSIGGGYKVSNGWESLGPAGFYGTFGPELSFAASFAKTNREPIAIAKFTHSGSQMVDWTPAGSNAKSRNLFPDFIKFVKESVTELESKGNEVEIAGIVYHVGENDMAYGPFRKQSSDHLKVLIDQSRIELDLPELKWFVSQQPPTNKKGVNEIDVTSKIATIADEDQFTTHVKVFDLKGREQEQVISTWGIVQLGEKLAAAVTNSKPKR